MQGDLRKLHWCLAVTAKMLCMLWTCNMITNCQVQDWKDCYWSVLKHDFKSRKLFVWSKNLTVWGCHPLSCHPVTYAHLLKLLSIRANLSLVKWQRLQRDMHVFIFILTMRHILYFPYYIYRLGKYCLLLNNCPREKMSRFGHCAKLKCKFGG